MSLTLRDLEICYSLAKEARDIEHRLERLKAYALRCSSSVAGGAHGSGNVGDRVGDGVAAYLDLEKEGQRKIAGFLHHIQYVEEAIDGLENSTHRTLLRLRYIDGLQWEEIGNELAYSRKQLQRHHNKSLESLGIEKMTHNVPSTCDIMVMGKNGTTDTAPDQQTKAD